jgi:hypothetical protein
MSTGRHSVRSRGRDLAIHIHREVGGEVLLAVVLMVNAIDKMLEVKQKALVNCFKCGGIRMCILHHPLMSVVC